ncbi:MAG TPA: hypothetical protein VGK19_24265 [Capsulimonadaceae bacterium]|jgi:hypothetical protein
MPTRIALIATALLLVVLLAVPASRRMLASDLTALCGRDDYARVPPASVPGGDVNAQLGEAVHVTGVDQSSLQEQQATQAGTLERLRTLARVNPTSAAVLANLLRYELDGEVAINRQNTCLLQPAPCVNNPGKYEEASAQELLVNATAATRAEPANGYFAMIRSYALYALKRDDAGLQELTRVAECAIWNEHYAEPICGRFRTFPWFDQGDTLASGTVYGTMHFSDLVRFRDLAKVVVSGAVEAEMNGNVAKGVRIRRDLRNAGVAMRAESRMLVPSLVGTAVVAISERRPGGAPLLPDGASIREDIRTRAAAAYLRSKGYAADAADVERQTNLNQQVRAINEASQAPEWSEFQILILARSAQRACLVLGLFVALWCALASLVTRSAGAANRPRTRLATGMALATVLGSAFVMANQWPGMFGGMTRTLMTVDGDHRYILIESAIVITLFTIPLLAILTVIAKNARPAAGRALRMARALRTATAVIACSYLALYAALAAPAYSLNATTYTQMVQQIENEPSALAAMVHKPWPGR